MESIPAKQRESVQDEYAQKLTQGTGFCAHTLETEFGYSASDLSVVPEEAASSSFGCANPLSMGDILPGDTVVDLGCGAGMDVILAAHRVGPSGRAIGIDMTKAMAQKARTNIATAGVESIAEVREGLIESLPIESNSVDWVISNCVVSLSPDKDRVFAEVFRVLKPGGKMLLTDQVVDPLPKWLRWLIAFKSPASAKAVDMLHYLAILNTSGLTNISVKGKLVYDAAMLEALMRDELSKRGSFYDALRSFDKDQWFAHLVDPLIPSLARRFSNKVASIKVYAEKPLG